MIRYASPCVASVGATKNPMYSPIAARIAAAAANQGSIRPGKRVEGLRRGEAEPVDHAVELIRSCFTAVHSFQGDPERRGNGPRREERGDREARPEQRQVRRGASSRQIRVDRARTEHQRRHVERQH